MPFTVDSDIRRASSLPSEVYRDAGYFERARERIFARSWQVAPDRGTVRARGDLHPFVLLPDVLDEPLLLVAGDAGAHCVSNVCTHRGNIVVAAPSNAATLRCGYHGRRFALDGRCTHMPEFAEVVDFPGERDHLRRLPLEAFGPMQFTALDPFCTFERLIAPLVARVASFPIDRAVFDPTSIRSHVIDANWALYCDNYLEGFHIPFVHAALDRLVEYDSYRTEVSPFGTIQIALARDGTDAFDLPSGHPDTGRRVAAYYAWLFPNSMLNVYPWGISLNIVSPLSPARTRIEFRAYVWDAARRGRSAGGDLDRVEAEDEAIVERVQHGIASRIHRSGRYSPTREVGVHHFHRLLAEWIGGAATG